MDTTRPTNNFKTAGGHDIVYKSFINKLEERQITEIYLKSLDEKKADSAPGNTGRVKFAADDKAFEMVIVSMDGKSENLLQRILELPTAEYAEISEVVKNVIEPKKK